jgi:hypothetical protein
MLPEPPVLLGLEAWLPEPWPAEPLPLPEPPLPP